MPSPPHDPTDTYECPLWNSPFWTEHEHFGAGEVVDLRSLDTEHLLNAVISI